MLELGQNAYQISRATNRTSPPCRSLCACVCGMAASEDDAEGALRRLQSSKLLDEADAAVAVAAAASLPDDALLAGWPAAAATLAESVPGVSESW